MSTKRIPKVMKVKNVATSNNGFSWTHGFVFSDKLPYEHNKQRYREKHKLNRR